MWDLIRDLATVGLAAIGLYWLAIAAFVVLMLCFIVLGGILSALSGSAETAERMGNPRIPSPNHPTKAKGGWPAVAITLVCLAAIYLPLALNLTRSGRNSSGALGVDRPPLPKQNATNGTAAPPSERNTPAERRESPRGPAPTSIGNLGGCSGGADCKPPVGDARSSPNQPPLPAPPDASELSDRASTTEHEQTDELWFAKSEWIRPAACKRRIPRSKLVVHDSTDDSWFLVSAEERPKFEGPRYAYTAEELDARLQRSCPW